MPKFTGQHYRAVAKILADHVGVERYVDCDETLSLLTDLVAEFSALFQADNSRFDSGKFVEACKNRK